MGQGKTTSSRVTKPPAADREEGKSGASSPPNGSDGPVIPPTELSKVVAELQSRLANIEKRKSTHSRRKQGSSDAEGDSTAAIESTSPSALQETRNRKLDAIREREQSLDIEEVALHTRAKAAAQEELLIRHETQTLKLKLQTFRGLTRQLREQESLLAAAREALNVDIEKLAGEQRQLERAKQELAAERGAVEAEWALIREREVALAAPFAAMARSVGSTSLPASSQDSATYHTALIASLATLTFVALAALAGTLAYLTVKPIYRATATLAPAIAGTSPSPSDHFPPAVLSASRSLLEQRGLRPYESDEGMLLALNHEMTLSFGAQQELNLTLDAPEREQAILVLEALTRSYAKAHANRNVAITRAAAADLAPIRDGRMARGMLYFLLFAMLIVAATYSAKRYGIKWFVQQRKA